METETKAPVVAKKVWSVVRVLLVMLRKGIAKTKIMLELNLLLKRGKLAGKAFADGTHMLHHHLAAAFASRSSHHHSFISPRDYEFSCSNSPAFPFAHAMKATKRSKQKTFQYDDVTTVSAVQKVLEMLNNSDQSQRNNHHMVEASPLVTLPGFGKSPIGRQLRVTDSPFPLKDEGDSQVDKAAEEFIKKFYKELNLQRTMAVIDSPYHKCLWDRAGAEPDPLPSIVSAFNLPLLERRRFDRVCFSHGGFSPGTVDAFFILSSPTSQNKRL
ncbi:uncharacterized protein G2W53_025225 [Senna tora]|uniref:Uncharacterized protein n=1 Tax=Senna tora TaxID=362788 RepID=A0A834WDY2_9FABA|nr:uncharacterized protein G2W53_025225 [Senna tora]